MTIKGKTWMEDGDDSHFSDNPAVPKKHTAKKHGKAHHAVNNEGIHKEKKRTVGGKKIVATKTKLKSVSKSPQTHKKVTRKRVAGK